MRKTFHLPAYIKFARSQRMATAFVSTLGRSQESLRPHSQQIACLVLKLRFDAMHLTSSVRASRLPSVSGRWTMTPLGILLLPYTGRAMSGCPQSIASVSAAPHDFSYLTVALSVHVTTLELRRDQQLLFYSTSSSPTDPNSRASQSSANPRPPALSLQINSRSAAIRTAGFGKR